MSPLVAVPQKSGFIKKLLHIVSALFFVAFIALWIPLNLMGNRPIVSTYRTHLLSQFEGKESYSRVEIEGLLSTYTDFVLRQNQANAILGLAVIASAILHYLTRAKNGLKDESRRISPDKTTTDSVFVGLKTVSTGQRNCGCCRESMYSDDGR